MEIVKGFPSTMQDDYQLNLINMIRHGVRNFEKREIVWKQGDTMHRHTYADAYERIKRLANALERLGVSVGDRVAVVGRKAHKLYRTARGVELLGPRHFGFDLDYVPIEDRMVEFGM